MYAKVKPLLTGVQLLLMIRISSAGPKFRSSGPPRNVVVCNAVLFSQQLDTNDLFLHTGSPLADSDSATAVAALTALSALDHDALQSTLGSSHTAHHPSLRLNTFCCAGHL